MIKIFMTIKNINVNYTSGNLPLFMVNSPHKVERSIPDAQSAVKLHLFSMTMRTTPNVAVVIKSAIIPFILLNLIP